MNGIQKANAQSHTHSQFASANATPKIAKEYVLPTLNPNKKETSENQAERKSTMHNNVYKT